MKGVFLDSFSAEGILAKAASLTTEPLTLAWGLRKPLRILHETLSQIQIVVLDAAAKESVGPAGAEWAEELNDVANDVDDVLDEINYEVVRHQLEIKDRIKKKVLNFFSLSNPLAFRLKTTHKIKKINASLVDLKSRAPVIELVARNVYATHQRMRRVRDTNSLIGAGIIVGRAEAVSNIVATLTSSYINREYLSVMAIVGMSGLGKTTVAQEVFNDCHEIATHSDEKIWVYVSDTFVVKFILSRILEGDRAFPDRSALIDPRLEEIGKEIAKKCAGVTEDDFGSVAKCKMHVLVHELAQLISKSESFTWDSEQRADTRSRRLRHVAHTSEVEIISQVNVRKLRSLFSNGEVPSALTDKLPRFKAIHVLNLYKAGIEGLPNSIGQLKQLRLKVFLKEKGDLVNLRHIYFGHVPEKRHANFGWYGEPRVRVGQLTNLRTMSFFIVGHQMGYGIEELGGLNQLKGELTIYDLENVRDGDEAKKANLVGKKKIRKLTLVWGEQTRLSKTNEEYGVLEGLQPQPQLEILEIRNFMGAKFSLWKQLYNLKKIRLLQFDICEEVTMLGHRPNLMHLEFDKMIHLKGLGAEFYGNNADGSVEDTRSTGETGALFPALKTLSICAAPNLTEWKEAPV
ncbi:hypothetical protein DVH24_028032 [Malus domestica]|uniref:NB-ARC domain-containing protein n=1 Tax=Malus domestica TaxID=3750 RepID=A0A498HEK5_MALDO|nr:hypothetical protein DVH24_028032 [Malus domestica]